MADDIRYMQYALALAQRGAGRTSPNPSVGCVVVSKEGRIVGAARSADGGRPHAETQALAQAGDRAHGATAYVTLEPCATVTATPSCADCLIEAGIARVVSGFQDPDHRTCGNGFAKLRAAGVDVKTDVLARDAERVHAGFISRVLHGRPLVTLKIAQSLDGRTASASGDSKWITGEEARRYGHLLRARNDAILIGSGTALADDPELTCRIPGLEDFSPLRVVLDTRLRLNEWSKLAQTAKDIPTLVFTTSEGGGALSAAGAEVLQIERDVAGRPSIDAVLKTLAQRGVNTLLVEGGASVHAAFIDGGFADRLEVFHAPLLLGGSGHNSIDALAALGLDEAPRFVAEFRHILGRDLVESFAREA
ncbi:MAG TPA: bifunctional diaminohydroxyphosphoribosylaminopyrimidine deaminase/5-amino-6-(5-phosphoribosylamino)uracil reductase RibD [Rhizomicrobium sp.]|nr:bifunctional diaminohydroxyphosphoribosylaminopyrimidine deaminase/5-amino-6-(5-phosphoribosylamino)uracil reductase RibD [Rhizomicrobium sp.]